MGEVSCVQFEVEEEALALEEFLPSEFFWLGRSINLLKLMLELTIPSATSLPREPARYETAHYLALLVGLSTLLGFMTYIVIYTALGEACAHPTRR